MQSLPAALPDRQVKFPQLLARDRGRAAAWPNSGAEQRFIGIDVADAAQQFLIEQRAFDRSLAAME